MKKLKNLNGAKVLSKKQQKLTIGGTQNPQYDCPIGFCMDLFTGECIRCFD